MQPTESAIRRQAAVICTLGMHRSGTSLVSRLLNLLGVDLGPSERVQSVGPDNPKGYWEHRPIADINDAILERFGGSWDAPPPLPPDWVADLRLADLADRARRLLAEDFSGRPLWGWKDPRTALTLPFWQALVGPMRYVICVRNPSDVMHSLAVRGSMAGAKTERLWLAYMAAILRHTSGQPRLFVFYEDVIDNWQRELHRLAGFIGRSHAATDRQVREAAAAFSDPTLCHHQTSLSELLEDQRVSYPVKSLYAMIKAREQRSEDGTDILADEALTLVADDALATCDRLQAHAAEQERAAHAHDALASLHASVAWKAIRVSRVWMADLLPPGTRRHRAWEVLRRRIARRMERPAAAAATDVSVCLCTLAIHAPYRQRARLLCTDTPSTPWLIVTDDPGAFSGLDVRTIHREPTGPMAVDYLERLPPTGEGRGAAAYHDKRFAVRAALEQYETAIFLDADSRIAALPALRRFPAGIAALPVVRKSIAEHLETCGSWRLPVFVDLARELTGDPGILNRAAWCHETCYAVTRDGNEQRFFWAWDRAVAFMEARGIHSGEGGVMGLAAAFAGWTVNYDVLVPLGDAIRHEGGGPKEE